ncbi:uncharacterized protein LOC123292538 [Chrysoperla carnea]|uniref:uncharacterized protein LOC123292538 n=1 Tax=Chrysoperla carnea TaxID=189513 RepID=UPI001D06131B|nr:uncharacterized protein LOC123292538 [Chrysoperla carnea]
MDIRKFLRLVEQHKCLWDPNDPTYSFRDQTKLSWVKISEEMRVPENDLRKKWRGLRDCFVKELKKAHKRKAEQGPSSELQSKWCYFKMLLFLKDTINRGEFKTSSTLEAIDSHDPFEESFPPQIESKVDEENTNYTSRDSFEFEENSIKLEPSINGGSLENIDEISMKLDPPISEKVPNNEEFAMYNSQDLLENCGQTLRNKPEPPLKRRILCVEEHGNDADAQFLMSLLPFLKEVPHDRKLLVRAKLQQVFIDEQNHKPPNE